MAEDEKIKIISEETEYVKSLLEKLKEKDVEIDALIEKCDNAIESYKEIEHYYDEQKNNIARLTKWQSLLRARFIDAMKICGPILNPIKCTEDFNAVADIVNTVQAFISNDEKSRWFTSMGWEDVPKDEKPATYHWDGKRTCARPGCGNRVFESEIIWEPERLHQVFIRGYCSQECLDKRDEKPYPVNILDFPDTPAGFSSQDKFTMKKQFMNENPPIIDDEKPARRMDEENGK